MQIYIFIDTIKEMGIKISFLDVIYRVLYTLF